MGKPAKRSKKTKARKRKDRAQRRGKRLAAILMYGKAAKEVLPKYFTPNCCLNGTRVAIEALAHFGVTVTPVVTQTTIFNKLFYDLMIEKGGLPEGDEMMEWCERGAWSLGVGGGGPGYDFHLIGVAENWLIDSSFGQFSRPQHDIHTDFVLVHPVNKEFLRDQHLVLENKHGNIIWYRAIPEEKEYLTVSGFQPHAGNLEVAQKVIEAMKTRMQ